MKVLMVCLGNICRSPLAEGIMRHLSNEKNLNWQIASAGTGDWHVGQQPDKRSIATAKKNGYDIRNQRAQHFNRNMFAVYDHIFVMDRENLSDVLQMANDDTESSKVKLFLDNGEVTDPYYDNSLFDPVCLLIEERCKEIISELS